MCFSVSKKGFKFERKRVMEAIMAKRSYKKLSLMHRLALWQRANGERERERTADSGKIKGNEVWEKGSG